MAPLGIRNNNPLNIRRSKNRWKGEVRVPSDSLSKGEKSGQGVSASMENSEGSGFCQFNSIEWGLRAGICLLRTYKRKYHLNCIADIIMRWAPPDENETGQYIRNVCHWTGIAGLQHLTESDWPALIKAMARQECGVQLDDETIERGFFLYRLTK